MPLEWTICAGILLSVAKDLHKPGLAVSPILLETSVGYLSFVTKTFAHVIPFQELFRF